MTVPRGNVAERRRAHRRSFRPTATAAAIACVLLLAACDPVSSTPDQTDGVTGTVFAVAQVGDLTVIGGSFTAVGGLPRSNIAAIRADGTVDPAFAPDADGTVYALAGVPGTDRVIAGGSFSNVGGVPRAKLAALDVVTSTVEPGWSADANDDVFALAVSGGRVYAGGRFTSIGGSTRRRLAALDVDTGSVNLGFNPFPDWTVKAVGVSPDGSRVYATGGFTAIGGAPRRGGAELQASDGRATTFNPTKGGVGIALAVTPDGGRFYFSTTDNRVYGYSPSTSDEPVQTIQGGGDTQAIAASATHLYIGGHFSQVWTGQEKVKRSHIASVDIAANSITTWDPGAGGIDGVWALAVAPGKLLVGGDFNQLGGVVRPGFGRFSGTP